MSSFLMANAEFSKFSRSYMHLKRELPIRPSEMGVLNILVQTQGPHTSVRLAELLGVSKPMVTAHITALMRAGYVTKMPSPADGRAAYILPTEKARALVSAVQAETDAQLRNLKEALGAEDFEALVSLMTRTNHILEEYIHGLER